MGDSSRFCKAGQLATPIFEKFIKKVNWPLAHFISHPAIFNSSIGQDLAHCCMSEFPKLLEYVQKSKVMEMFQKRFY
jgi:hypothetical protein